MMPLPREGKIAPGDMGGKEKKRVVGGGKRECVCDDEERKGRRDGEDVLRPL
jgi:hypothetical protein